MSCDVAITWEPVELVEEPEPAGCVPATSGEALKVKTRASFLSLCHVYVEFGRNVA